MPVVAILALAVGTYALRLVGPLARERWRPSARVQALLSRTAVVVLVALVATSALIEGTAFAGWARPAGVLVAAVLVARKVAFPVVVLAAAGTTAGLRLLGVA